MSCNCEKKGFILKAPEKEYTLLALDDCVFCTLISFPENDEDIAEMMWEQVQLNNSISDNEKEILKLALVEFYHSHKLEYSNPQSECNGCSGCG